MLEFMKCRKRRRHLLTVLSEEESCSVDCSPWQHMNPQTNTHVRSTLPVQQYSNDSIVSEKLSRTAEPERERSYSRNVSQSFLSILVVTIIAIISSPGFMIDSTNAFQPGCYSTRRTSAASCPRSYYLPLPMVLSTPPSSTTSSSQQQAIPSKSELESMKVVELKELIKESGLNERGLLSKLKKKQDLVDFLTEQGTTQLPVEGVRPPNIVIQQSATDPSTSKSTEEKQQQQQKPTKPKKVRMTMVKKSPSIEIPPATLDTDGEESLAPKKQHPMQDLLEQTELQYPALKYLTEGNTTKLADHDIRQRYHPMLQGIKNRVPVEQKDDECAIDENDNEECEPTPALSGDMDLVFVGTASCTPSMTRGVSCTALCLHSLPSSTSAKNKQQKQQPSFKKGKNGERKKFDVAERSQTNLGTWLFDCGEGTQLQVQRTSSIRPSKISKIFLTHAHGDHSFGLPGLLCMMGQDTSGGNESAKGPNGENIKKTRESKKPIDIYGPEGLRLWLRTAIRYSVSRIVPHYRVHELKDVAMAPEWGYSAKWEKYYFDKRAHKHFQETGFRNNRNFYWGAANHKRQEALNDRRRRGQPSDWMSLCDLGVPKIKRSEMYGEVEGGRDIYPIYDHPLSSDGAPVWEVENENGVKVYAGPMSHGVPCVGYVVQESDRPGRLRDEYVKPIALRNMQALKDAGFQHPMKALAVIKDLPEGGAFTFPDGTVVTQEEAVEPTRPGRKVVICGDTNSSRGIEKLAENADVVVHEATNSYLPAFDFMSSEAKTRQSAIYHGHSTPEMAGEFSKRVKAKRLILNHFSARYLGCQALENMAVMTHIEQKAMKASGLSRENVAAAWDFMIFPVPKADKRKSSADEETD